MPFTRRTVPSYKTSLYITAPSTGLTT